MSSGPYLLLLLLLAVLFIVWGTAKAKIHPFLVLLLAGYGLGLAGGIPATETVKALTEGLGRTVSAIGIVIAAGTIIGIFLERSGGAHVLADTVLRWIGRARTSLAMSLTGALVSIPVFCDSGFIILSPLVKSLSKQSGRSIGTLAVALSMGLYTTHVFVPPTPGPVAAAGELGVGIGQMMLLGLVIAVPVTLVTHFFAVRAGRNVHVELPDDPVIAPDASNSTTSYPTALAAFLPITIPVVLIALNSLAGLPSHPFGEGTLSSIVRFAGDPNTALLIGVLFAFRVVKGTPRETYGTWVGDALKEAGNIILITGAGGALGRVLQATPIGDYLGTVLSSLDLGPFSILLPFLIAAAFKTALGSSTVAMITTATITLPLLPTLGLAGGTGPAYAALAVGAGAMVVSHANDSFFWVVSQFSGMSVTQAYRLHSTGSAVAGLTGIVSIMLLRFLFP